MLDSNPANGGGFTFQDADALDHLALSHRAAGRHEGHERLLAKRDTGYGQGPGQFIADGQPYRLDVWWQAAQCARDHEDRGADRARARDGRRRHARGAPRIQRSHRRRRKRRACRRGRRGECPAAADAGNADEDPPEGLAAAGEDAPGAVKRMVAAGNRLFDASYLTAARTAYRSNTLQPRMTAPPRSPTSCTPAACSANTPRTRPNLRPTANPAPARYVSIYANAEHAFMYVGGLRFDTVEDPDRTPAPTPASPAQVARLPHRSRLVDLDRPTPTRPMNNPVLRLLARLLSAVVALAGCTNPDAPSTEHETASARRRTPASRRRPHRRPPSAQAPPMCSRRP